MAEDTRLTIVIPDDIKRKYKSKAAYEGKDLTEKTIELIERYLQEKD